MSFWTTSDGDSATSAGNSYETPGTDIEPIPDNSSVLARITSAKWDSPRDDDSVEFISLEWTVAQPESYANRKIWQKLWVTDDDPSAKDDKAAARKKDNAKRMLAAIDANATGKLAKKANRPSDEDLALALTNRPMVIKVKVWEIKGSSGGVEKSGNWICGVSAKTSTVEVGASKPKPASKPLADDLGDDIPF